jgi:hypothetical protein
VPLVDFRIDRSGRLRRQSNIDRHIAAFDPHRIRRQVLIGRRAEAFAGGDMEDSLVQRAFDTVTVYVALRQEGVSVRADVVQRKIRIADAVDRALAAAYGECERLASRTSSTAATRCQAIVAPHTTTVRRPRVTGPRQKAFKCASRRWYKFSSAYPMVSGRDLPSITWKYTGSRLSFT